jgi:hypothetical protein
MHDMGHMKEKWAHRDERKGEGIEATMYNQHEDEQQAQKPVAYDVDGRPLYAAPVEQNLTPPPQVVHVARSAEPVPVEVSEETRKRHDESMRAFPWLNLSDHEYIISAVRRHPVGMWGPLLATSVSISVIFILLMNYPYFSEILGLPMASYGTVLLIGILMALLFLIGGYLAIWVYMSNHFFLTNESVIQEIQASIFSKKEQTVSLMNIEDASYSQRGPMQTILNYGSIRLSTEGEETTYRFDYVANPKEQIAILNNAVEAFKNGRPVEGPTDTNESN